MKKLWLAILVSFGIFTSLSAQDETQVLRNYKYRYSLYRQSGVNFHSGFISNNYEFRDTFGIYNFGDNIRRSNWNFNYSRNVHFNSESKIFNSGIYVSSNISKDAGRRQLNSTAYGNASTGFFANQWKYRPGSTRYLRTGIQADVYGNQNQWKGSASVQPLNTMAYNYHTGVLGTVAFGRGRMENISDASFASFWLRDMRSKGLIKVYTANEIETIAKAITRARNTRYMDFRFRTIGQVEMLDSAFRSLGLLTNTSAAYYTTLYDHFLYANNFQRFHGKNSEIGISADPGISGNYQYSRQTDTNAHYSLRNTNYNAAFRVFYQYTSDFAISLHSQWSFYNQYSAGLEYSNLKTRAYNYVISPADAGWSSPDVQVTVGLNYRYIPNTRSFMNAYVRSTGTRDLNREVTNLFYTLTGGIEYYYWLSQHFQFRAGGNMNFSKTLTRYSGTEKKMYWMYYRPDAGISLSYVFY